MFLLSYPLAVVTFILPFLVVLTIVVFFHEMGHFLVGRWCGVKVDTFSLGFGPELCHYTSRRTGTRWRIAALPLGGYVKFHGDANAASMTDEEMARTMPSSERSVSLFAQKVWKRAAIVAAGPAANFLLSIVIFAAMFHFVGREVLSPQIAGVRPDSAASEAGFEVNDIIKTVDGRKITSFFDLQRMVMTSDGAMTFGIDREGDPMTLTATPRKVVNKDPGFGPSDVLQLGVEPANTMVDLHVEKYGVADSLAMGVDDTWFILKATGQYLGRIVRGRESADQISGPIGTAVISHEVAKHGIGDLMRFAAVLSVSIGLLNLLPIPLLDGGFLMFFAYEAIRGKALGERMQMVGFRIGLTLVAGLSIFAAVNDIVRNVVKPYFH